MTTIALTIEVDDKELASAVFDNLWRNISPWIERTNWPLDEPSGIVSVIHNNESDEMVTTVVTFEMLGKGLQQAINEHWRHCGEPIPTDLDEWDTCCSDMVLQGAIFGKLVFG